MFDNGPGKWGFSHNTCISPFFLQRHEGSCHVQCHWGRAHTFSLGSCRQSLPCLSLPTGLYQADAHLFFFYLFSGTHSVSAGAVLVLLSQGGDENRWAPHLPGIRKVLFARGLHFLSALYNSRAVVIPAGSSGEEEEQSPGTLQCWGTNNSKWFLGCVFHREL